MAFIMRKGTVIIGMILLAVGAGMFFIGPVVVNSSLSPAALSSLADLTNAASLAQGQNITIASVPVGSTMAIVYNDSISAPLAFTVSNITTEQANQTYIGIYVNSGTSPQVIGLVNNSTQTVLVNYGSAPFSIGGILEELVFLGVGAILMIAGVIIAIVGLLSKRKAAPAGGMGSTLSP